MGIVTSSSDSTHALAPYNAYNFNELSIANLDNTLSRADAIATDGDEVVRQLRKDEITPEQARSRASNLEKRSNEVLGEYRAILRVPENDCETWEISIGDSKYQILKTSIERDACLADKQNQACNTRYRNVLIVAGILTILVVAGVTTRIVWGGAGANASKSVISGSPK